MSKGIPVAVGVNMSDIVIVLAEYLYSWLSPLVRVAFIQTLISETWLETNHYRRIESPLLASCRIRGTCSDSLEIKR